MKDEHLQVTPHVGVWIETLVQKKGRFVKQVTPHVGVWIETLPALERNREGIGSHLM